MILAPVLAASLLVQPAPAADDPNQAITQIRAELVEGFNKGDVDAMSRHFASDIVAIWQDGTVCHGAAEIRAYYQRLMTGPDKLIAAATTSPQVDGRHLFGDTAVSYGRFNDSYQLTSGETIALDSRFTATLVKHDGAWKVASFHASGNMFNNDSMKFAVKKTALYIGVTAGVAGLGLGALLGFIVARRRAPHEPAAPSRPDVHRRRPRRVRRRPRRRLRHRRRHRAPLPGHGRTRAPVHRASPWRVRTY